MAATYKNKRLEERYSVRMKVEYLLDGGECEKLGTGLRESFTTDISHSGMGLFSDCKVNEGQTIRIYLRHVFKEPIVAEVKWYSKQADNLYKLGVRYLSPPSSSLLPQ